MDMEHRAMSDSGRLALVEGRLDDVRKEVSDLGDTIDRNQRDTNAHIDKVYTDLNKSFDKYVTVIEFTPVRTGVYGLITLIVVAVISAVIASVVKP